MLKRLITVKALNLGLRGFTIVLKFLLSILIIKKLSIQEYGTFGLFQSTIIIMTFVLGFDFYTFTSREILKEKALEYSYYLKHQMIFHLIGYALVLPLSYLIIKWDIIESRYFLLFLTILISEHLSQELYRVLIILGKSVAATFILFVRSGLWVILLYFLWEYKLVGSTIGSLLNLWLIGATISVLIGFWHLKFRWVVDFDFSVIKEGIKIAFPFFIGTVLYKIIEFSGRYFLNFYSSEEELGVFTFFSSIANVLFVFVQTVVIIVMYPLLLESKNKGYKAFTVVLKEFKKQIYNFTIIGIVLSLIFIYPLLLFLDKTVLLDNLLSYTVLLCSTLFYCFSFISHYALYSYKFDVKILIATATGLISNLVISFILVPKFGVFGASIAQLGSFLIIYISKTYYWKKCSKSL